MRIDADESAPSPAQGSTAHRQRAPPRELDRQLFEFPALECVLERRHEAHIAQHTGGHDGSPGVAGGSDKRRLFITVTHQGKREVDHGEEGCVRGLEQVRDAVLCRALVRAGIDLRSPMPELYEFSTRRDEPPACVLGHPAARCEIILRVRGTGHEEGN